MSPRNERKQLAILEVLQSSGKPLTGSRITEELAALWYEISGMTDYILHPIGLKVLSECTCTRTWVLAERA